MSQDILIERLFEALISGDRPASRKIVEETLSDGAPAEVVTSDLLWPTYELVSRMHREDKLGVLPYQMATRLLRVLQDQTAAQLTNGPAMGRSIFAVCGPTDSDELAAQMAVDLLEAQGFTVTFAGGGIARDEVQEAVQEQRPDVLLLFASAPADLPGIRALIDTLREVGACDSTQIAVGGGVFNRADGLAEEIGADVWATTPGELVSVLAEQPQRRAAASQRTVGRAKRRREAA